MPEIKIADGREEYSLNGKVKVLVNVSDSGWIERFFNTFESVDKVQEDYSQRIEGASGREVFDIAREIDAAIRAKINELFDTDICTPLFDGMQVTAIADGLPVWCNLMLAFMDAMDERYTAEKAKTNPRLQKYITKYKRK